MLWLAIAFLAISQQFQVGYRQYKEQSCSTQLIQSNQIVNHQIVFLKFWGQAILLVKKKILVKKIVGKKFIFKNLLQIFGQKNLSTKYLSHFETTLEAEILYGSFTKPNQVNQPTRQPSSSFQEMPGLAPIFVFWSYLSHQFDFDGVKKKLCLWLTLLIQYYQLPNPIYKIQYNKSNLLNQICTLRTKQN